MSGAELSPIDQETGLERRDVARARLLGHVPRFYNPWVHLACTSGVGLAVLVLAAVNVHHVRLVELLIVPLTFFFATGFEWRVHKTLLHKRTFPFQELYDRHTPDHHAIYHESDMAMRSTNEFRLVLIPAIGIAGIVASTAPFAWLVARVLGANAGWLFLMASGVFMVSYELLHLSYHLPPESFIGRLRAIRFLARHHARHHDPRLMRRWNFNVTLPVFDWLYGTIAPEGDARIVAKAPQRSPLAVLFAQKHPPTERV